MIRTLGTSVDWCELPTCDLHQQAAKVEFEQPPLSQSGAAKMGNFVNH